MSTKKPGTKKLIAGGTVKRQLKKEGLRVASKAAEEVKSHIALRLKTLGSESAKVLMISKKKTVTQDVLKHAAMYGYPCISMAYIVPQSTAKGVPVASAVRAFKRGLGSDYRIDADAKLTIAGIADHMISSIGDTAANIAHAEKRKTIKARDVFVAEGKKAPVKTAGGLKGARGFKLRA